MPRLSSAYQAVLRSCVDSVKVNSVSWGAEALYYRLLLISDGFGRYHGGARDVACKAATRRFGASTDIEEIEGFLRELEQVGLLLRWSTGTEQHLQLQDYFDAGNRQKAAFPAPPDTIVPQQGIDVPQQVTDIPLIGDRGVVSSDRRVVSSDRGSENTRGAARKPRRDGVDELRSAITAWDGEHGPMPSGMATALDEYRIVRKNKRWSVWPQSTWTRSLAQCGDDADVILAAVENAIIAPHMKLYPKPAPGTKFESPQAKALQASDDALAAEMRASIEANKGAL